MLDSLLDFVAKISEYVPKNEQVFVHDDKISNTYEQGTYEP